MKKHIDQLKALDYSHIYTTAVDHIIEIYEEAKKHKGVVFQETDICELTGKGGVCGV